jgi:hypothetical protein
MSRGKVSKANRCVPRLRVGTTIGFNPSANQICIGSVPTTWEKRGGGGDRTLKAKWAGGDMIHREKNEKKFI